MERICLAKARGGCPALASTISPSANSQVFCPLVKSKKAHPVNEFPHLKA